DLGLRKFELADHEWKVVKQLHTVLKILKDDILFFSHSAPDLATAIPAMDHIHKHLTIYVHNKSYLKSICSVVSLAKATLDCYYLLTGSSEIYCIAMVLHPCYKLAYFKIMYWEEEWIKTAEALVCDKYTHSY
ncbi:hypothetical protein PAXRUDRAFT_46795, partial [Paxillus rubicundulus Ve08.2h10]